MPGFEVFGEEERKACNELFDINNGILFAHGFGKARKDIYRVREFEKAISEKLSVGYAQAVSSGTSALYTGLKALGIKEGDEVIAQSFTFVATVEAILAVGARPVIVEINETLNMDPADLQRKITKKTKAIISAQMDEIMSIAKNYNIRVFEDSAQSLGGTYKDRFLGTIGDAGIYSFDFGKTITCGEGGMVVTSNKDVFNEVRCLHDHGHEYNLSLPRGLDTRHSPGFNFRMTEIQAAIGLAQLKKLDHILLKQKENKLKLKEGLKNLPLKFRDLPDPAGDTADSCFIILESRELAQKIVENLTTCGLATKNVPDAMNWHFAGTWDHMLASFYKKPLLKEFERSWNILERTVALPIWVQTKEPWIEQYIQAISQVFNKVLR